MNYKGMLYKKSGVTLISLVITIIVLLILSGISIAKLTEEDGVIKHASNSKITTEFENIKNQVYINAVKENMKDNEVRYLNTEEAQKILLEDDKQYKNKIGMYRGNMVYLGEEDSKYGKIASEQGYTVLDMTSDEFKYYIELGVLEDSIQENKLIGRELYTKDFPEAIKVDGYTYTNGWYLIGNYTDDEKNNNTYTEQYTQLGLTDTTHAPYLVNYSTGYVVSIDGMEFKNNTTVHTFTEIINLLSKSIINVDDTSIKTGNYYGELYSTSLYTGPVHTSSSYDSANYLDNNGLLQYDDDGALILDDDNAIPVLEVNQKYKIDDEFSINVTVKGDIYQYGASTNHSRTIVAMSDDNSQHILWLGFYKGFLHVRCFTSSNMRGIAKEATDIGYASIDISKYDGKAMNIQVTSVRGQKTNVYINGELVKTFDSGKNQYTYTYTTLGDLRVGRNLKFIGKIYNFALFGVALNEEEVNTNWELSKKYVEESN